MYDKLKETTKQFLSLNNFSELTSVQKATLNHFNSKKDLVILSKTGTGKTHAYLIAISEMINPVSNKTQVLISLPTRELAYQIYKNTCVLKEVYKDLRILLLSGGNNKDDKINQINPPHIIIGTPGKLRKCFDNNKIRVDTIQLIIIDEADMTLEYGFLEDIDIILRSMIRHSKIMCFTATMKKEFNKFISSYLYHPVIEEIKDTKRDPKIKQYLVNTKHRDPNETLVYLLNNIHPYVCLIFANSKEECEKTYNVLIDRGFKTLLLHGGLESRDRKKAIKDLRDKKYSYVVCSDVASRGIDIDGCSHVISIGFPREIDFYTHRVGRTGRIGRDGEAYTIYSKNDVGNINKLIKKGNKFIFKDIKNGQLVDSKIRLYNKKNSKEVEDKIRKIVSKKDKKVKPNYKKKKRIAIADVKRKARRDFIKNEIKKQKKERYKKESREKNI